MNLKAKIIDNNFYLITSAQARWLSVTGKLPRPGYMVDADKEKVAQLELIDRRGKSFRADNFKAAYVQQTRLTWHDGKPISKGVVWALHVYFG